MRKSNLIYGTVLLIGVLVLPGCFVTAAGAQEDFKIISTGDLERWLESPQKPLLVFSLSEVEFLEERIPSSICIPMELMDQSSQLPAGLDDPVVFYCKGPG